MSNEYVLLWTGYTKFLRQGFFSRSSNMITNFLPVKVIPNELYFKNATVTKSLSLTQSDIKKMTLTVFVRQIIRKRIDYLQT